MSTIGKKQRVRRISDEQILAKYAETHSGNKTAKALGIDPKTVYQAIKNAGIERSGLTFYRENAAKFSSERSALIRAEYEAGGVSFADLATKHHGTEASIKSAIRRAGGKVRSIAPPLTPEEGERIHSLYESGISQTGISEMLGRSQSFISRTLREQYGLVHVPRRGNAHGMWKGGRMLTGQGYALVKVFPDDPMAIMRTKDGYVLEHRLVMARHLHRPLVRSETVHHINNQRDDNRIENLQLRNGKHGKGSVLVCADCGSHNIVGAPLSAS